MKCPRCGYNADSLFDDLPTQGARAGRSGESFELMMEAIFEARKVRSVNDNPEFHYEKQLFERNDKLLIRQVLIQGWSVDFLYKDFRRNLKVPIECKQQLGPGTTEEKLAYTVDKLIKVVKGSAAPGYWLVLSGDGFTQKITQIITNKIADTNRREKLQGRILYMPLLQRAVDNLVERGRVL